MWQKPAEQSGLHSPNVPIQTHRCCYLIPFLSFLPVLLQPHSFCLNTSFGKNGVLAARPRRRISTDVSNIGCDVIRLLFSNLSHIRLQIIWVWGDVTRSDPKQTHTVLLLVGKHTEDQREQLWWALWCYLITLFSSEKGNWRTSFVNNVTSFCCKSYIFPWNTWQLRRTKNIWIWWFLPVSCHGSLLYISKCKKLMVQPIYTRAHLFNSHLEFCPVSLTQMQPLDSFWKPTDIITASTSTAESCDSCCLFFLACVKMHQPGVNTLLL